MAVLIDTSVLIGIERRGLDLGVLPRLDRPDEDGLLCTISVSELLHGALRADSAQRRRAREEFIATLIDTIRLVPFDLDAARVHARLVFDLSRQGQAIGANDFIIAATALAGGHAVLSEDIRHFDRVPDLEVRRPKWPGEPSSQPA